MAWDQYVGETTEQRWYAYGPVGIGAGFACADEIHRYVTSDTLTHITILGPSRSAVSGNPTPLVTLTKDENDLDGDSDETEFQVLEHLVDRLGSNVALSWGDMGPGGAGTFGGPFIVESTEYLQGYGNTAYNDILTSGYVDSATYVFGATQVKVKIFTGAVPATNAWAGAEFIYQAGGTDNSYRVSGNSWYAPTSTLTISIPGNYEDSFAVDKYFEVWAKTYDISSVTTSGGRTVVNISGATLTADEHAGKFVTQLVGDNDPYHVIGTTFVVAENGTASFTIEALNTYWLATDRVRLYRRDSKFGIPYGWAGYWNIGRNVEYATNTWSALPPLYYVWNRHYHTQLGRWLTPDPLGLWGDPAQRGNPYQYCASLPLHIVDTRGLGPADGNNSPPPDYPPNRPDRGAAEDDTADDPGYTPPPPASPAEHDADRSMAEVEQRLREEAERRYRFELALAMWWSQLTNGDCHWFEPPQIVKHELLRIWERTRDSLAGFGDSFVEFSLIWMIHKVITGEDWTPFADVSGADKESDAYGQGRLIGEITQLVMDVATGKAGLGAARHLNKLKQLRQLLRAGKCRAGVVAINRLLRRPCFVEGTPVWVLKPGPDAETSNRLLAEGADWRDFAVSVPIEQIGVGCYVLSRSDLDAGDVLSFQPVVTTFVKLATSVVTLVVEDSLTGQTDAVTVTPYHPMWMKRSADSSLVPLADVTNCDIEGEAQYLLLSDVGQPLVVGCDLFAGYNAARREVLLTEALSREHRWDQYGHLLCETGWVYPADLEVGAWLENPRGCAQTVTEVKTTSQVSLQVYNLTVASTHTYFVGTNAVWTHNAYRLPADRITQLLRKAARRSNDAKYTVAGDSWRAHLARFFGGFNAKPTTANGAAEMLRRILSSTRLDVLIHWDSKNARHVIDYVDRTDGVAARFVLWTDDFVGFRSWP